MPDFISATWLSHFVSLLRDSLTYPDLNRSVSFEVQPAGHDIGWIHKPGLASRGVWSSNILIPDEQFKRQPHKIVKHTQKIPRLLPTNCSSVFDHFVGLVLKGIIHWATLPCYSRVKHIDVSISILLITLTYCTY